MCCDCAVREADSGLGRAARPPGNPVTPVSLPEAGPTDRTAAALRPTGTGSASAEAGFAAVDDATDPISLVHYLDRMAGQLDEVKRRIRQQLEVAEGEFVLDLGCGTGDDARGLSALVGPSGRIIGVDASITMVQEARRRAAGFAAVPLAFAIGDAQALPFAAASFDACRAERVLQETIDSFRLDVTLRQAVQAGVMTTTDKSYWLAELVKTAEAGCFVAAATCFLVRGIRPFGT